MKKSRQKCLVDIITKYDIETQEELLNKLREKGYDVTQATISRDIKDLKIIKVAAEYNRYKYAVSVSLREDPRAAAKYRNIINETVIKIDYAYNLVVLKTYPGMAQAAAAAIDSMEWKEVMGTIAGDDTIFLAVYSVEYARIFVEKFNEILN